ncbi:hypothetical protein [Desulfosarcina cetonica]|nr:hypothetical protein [Desulfosarcina cetonica]
MSTKTENSAQLATGHLLAQVCRLVAPADGFRWNGSASTMPRG